MEAQVKKISRIQLRKLIMEAMQHPVSPDYFLYDDEGEESESPMARYARDDMEPDNISLPYQRGDGSIDPAYDYGG